MLRPRDWIREVTALRRRRPPMPAGALQCEIAYNELGGYCIPLSSIDRPAARAVRRGHVWEPETLACIRRHVGDGDIVHAGTYFGDFLPALATYVASSAKVWAFEPNPENHRCASITVSLNQLADVELLEAALGSTSTTATMEVRDARGRALGGGSSLVQRRDPGPQGLADVRVVAIDDVVPADRKVDVIHLDVEGYEAEALEGAQETIRRSRPVLLLETFPAGGPVERRLLDLGYTVSGTVHGNTVLTAGAVVPASDVDGSR